MIKGFALNHDKRQKFANLFLLSKAPRQKNDFLKEVDSKNNKMT